MKQLLLILLLTLTTLFAHDARLNSYPQALEWEKMANTQSFAAFNLGRTYQTKIKDSDKAIFWYKKAYELDSQNTDAANNLGYLYEDLEKNKDAIFWYKEASKNGDADPLINLSLLYKKLHQYDNAIFYYKKAYEMGNIGGANGLGYLYETSLKDSKNAKLWYKKAAKKGYSKSYKNLALCNRDNGKKIEGAAWYIALIDLKYPKQKVLRYLKTKWKLTDEELKQAYKLQQTLDIPKHYTGGIE